MTQSTITIGYIRDDGDVAVLATLNNNDEHLDDDSFTALVATTVQTFANHTGEDVRAWERQDAPDYLDYDSATFGTDVTPDPRTVEINIRRIEPWREAFERDYTHDFTVSRANAEYYFRRGWELKP